MKELILIIVGSALVNNIILSQFQGLCPFLGVSKKVDTSIGMGCSRYLRNYAGKYCYEPCIRSGAGSAALRVLTDDCLHSGNCSTGTVR